MKITRTPGSDYRALVAVHGDVSTVATPEGRFAYVAPSSLRLLGWEPSALQGRPRTDFVHPEDIGVVGRGFASMGGGGLITTTYRFRRRDGRYVWVEDRSRTVVNDGSAVVVSTFEPSTTTMMSTRSASVRQLPTPSRASPAGRCLWSVSGNRSAGFPAPEAYLL
jgi:PAS domain S-box-containing protein